MIAENRQCFQKVWQCSSGPKQPSSDGVLLLPRNATSHECFSIRLGFVKKFCIVPRQRPWLNQRLPMVRCFIFTTTPKFHLAPPAPVCVQANMRGWGRNWRVSSRSTAFWNSKHARTGTFTPDISKVWITGSLQLDSASSLLGAEKERNQEERRRRKRCGRKASLLNTDVFYCTVPPDCPEVFRTEDNTKSARRR